MPAKLRRWRFDDSCVTSSATIEVINTRQHLVEGWKANLAVNTQEDVDRERSFAWFRQIYSRIYRFLISCYGEGEWRGAGEESQVSVGPSSDASRMAFVDYRSTTVGLVPKSAERIRATLDSIHDSNPGIAIPGTTTSIGDDTWVVVAARKRCKAANAVHRRLIVCGIDARIQNRTTDIAIAVPHKDFSAALYAIRHITPANRWWIRKQIDTTTAVGAALLAATILTGLTSVLVNETRNDVSFVVCALSFVALASIWLCVSIRKRQ